MEGVWEGAWAQREGSPLLVLRDVSGEHMSQGERCLEDDEDQKVCVEFRVFCNCRYSGLAGSGVS